MNAYSLTFKLPEGWHLTHLIHLDPEWQVIAKDDEHIAVATGESPLIAIMNIQDRIDAGGPWAGRLFHLSRLAEPAQAAAKSLLESLGLVGPPVKRRRIG